MSRDRIPQRVVDEVFARDQGCMAPRLGGSSLDCFGRDRLEHCKSEPRMAKRAEPDAAHLLVICEGHSEPGMKAGYVWCTDKVNRAACRAYLSEWMAAKSAAVAVGGAST